LCLWPLRRSMYLIRWAFVLTIGGLAAVMKVNVWWLMARVDFTGGSTGWDRAYLVDQFFKHFSDWWLIGTKDNASWGQSTWDQCNQFVAEGENGGLLVLVIFILILYRSYSRIGVARKLVDGIRGKEWLLWTLGATIVAHITAFMGVSYFDQTRIWW